MEHNYHRYEKLTAMPYAQAKVAITHYGSYLVSYSTSVALIKDGYLMVNGLYSMTTRKHLGAYAREYANADFAVAKRCALENLAYNIAERVFISRITGEVVA